MVEPVHLRQIPTELKDAVPIGSPGRQQSLTGPSFEQLLRQSLTEVNNLQQGADAKIEKLASGEITDLKEVMIAVEEANLAFDLTLQIRNKIVEAYQELQRLQI